MKLLLREPGTDESREIFFSAARIFSSRLLVPEASAALARAARTGRLAKRSADGARTTARSLLDQVAPIEVSADLAERAWGLAGMFPLRGYDAVHLASYERVRAGDSVFVVSDSALSRAALSLGYAVVVPA